MTQFANPGELGLLLEAEVAPGAQTGFQQRYLTATGDTITPGNPNYYQTQVNKWGSELRVYFNDPGMATALEAFGVYVEYPRTGYRAGEYRYRFNNNDLWWKLVEVYGLRLGPN